MKLLRKTNLLLRVYIYGTHFILRSSCLRKETMNNRSIVTENNIKEGKRVLFFIIQTTEKRRNLVLGIISCYADSLLRRSSERVI